MRPAESALIVRVRLPHALERLRRRRVEDAPIGVPAHVWRLARRFPPGQPRRSGRPCYDRRVKQMYHPSDLAAMDPLVLMKNLDHVRMTSRRLSYILQQQVHLYAPEANQLREQIDRYVEAERQIEGEMARRQIRA